MLVRWLSPLALTEFADVLAGKPWPGFSSGRVALRLDGPYSDLGDLDTLLQRGAHLFSGRIGRTGRLLEVLHLKLNLVLQVLTETRAAIRLQQLPFLTLGADSFRARLSETGTGLPFLWTAQVDLVESSCAIPRPLKKRLPVLHPTGAPENVYLSASKTDPANCGRSDLTSSRSAPQGRRGCQHRSYTGNR